MALESARNLERSQWKGLLHRFGHSDRGHSLFLRIFAAASRDYTHRRNRQRRFLAAYGWRSEYLLEKQSVPHPALHRRERFPASAVGDSRPHAKSDGRQYSHRMGEPIRDSLGGAVLDR